PVVELAGRPGDGHHFFESRLAGIGLDADGNAAAVVAHCRGTIFVENDADVRTVSSQRLIDRVVDNLIHEVMETGRLCIADIHAGVLSYMRSILESLDVLGCVFPGWRRRGERGIGAHIGRSSFCYRYA